jgi:hypothetical protein
VAHDPRALFGDAPRGADPCVAECDKVAANIRVFFRKSSNDRMVQFDFAAFYTLRDGRIDGYSGMLVFFTFMPLGAAIGGIGGALLFGVIAIRDAEIAIEQGPVRRWDR